jgi:hypothetical protein
MRFFEIVIGLQAQPEALTCAEGSGEPHGGVGC